MNTEQTATKYMVILTTTGTRGLNSHFTIHVTMEAAQQELTEAAKKVNFYSGHIGEIVQSISFRDTVNNNH